jgi:hypothetical protein
MKTVFNIRSLYLGGILGCLLVALSNEAQAQIPQLHQLQFTADTSLTVRVFTESDTAALLVASHYPKLRLATGPQPVLTQNAAVQSLTLPLPKLVYKGFLRLKDPLDSLLYTDLAYALTDSAMLATTGQAISKHGEVTFMPAAANNLKRVLLVRPQFQPMADNMPVGLMPISSPIGIASWPDVSSFSGSNTLRLRYNAYGSSDAEKLAIRLYAWNSSSSTWEVAVAAPAIDTAARTATAAITKPGVYALFTITDFTGVVSYFEARTQSYRSLALSTVEHFSTIDSLAEVQSSAGQTIFLSPGFHAKRGSRFTTTIQTVTSLPNVRIAAPEPAGGRDGAGGNAVWEQGSSPEQEQETARIFPNPAGHKFTLAYELPVAQPVSAVLYTLTGKQAQLLLESAPREAGPHQEEFDASGLQAGVYILSLQFEKGAEPSPGATAPNTEASYRRQALKLVKTP